MPSIVWLGLLALATTPVCSNGAPANDDFAEAIQLTGGSHHELAAITEATLEPGEPAVDDGATGTVWWRWTASISGQVFIRTEDLSAVSIWQGTALFGLQAVPVHRLASSMGPPFNDPRFWASTLSFAGEAGTDYFIRVAGPSNPFQTQVSFTLDLSNVGFVSPADGFETSVNQPVALKTTTPNPVAEGVISNLLFHVDARFPIAFLSAAPSYRLPPTEVNGTETVLSDLPPNEYRVHATFFNTAGQLVATVSTNTFLVRPANDGFADAREVSALPYNENVVPLDVASEEAGEPVNADQFDGRSVWWRWTAPRDMALVARGLTMGAFEGTTPETLQAVGYERFATLRLNAVAGQTYHFRTTPRAMVQSPLPQTLSFVRLAEISGNDDFANRQPLVGNEIAFAVPDSVGSYESGEPTPESPSYPHLGSFWWTWHASEGGLLLLPEKPPALVGRPGILDAYLGTELVGLQRLLWVEEPALPGWRGYRVRAGDPVQVALNGGTWPFGTMRLRFIPDQMPGNRMQPIRASADHISLIAPELPGGNWHLESSTTLTNWSFEQVVSAGTGDPVFIGPIQITGDRKFFRLSEMPPE